MSYLPKIYRWYHGLIFLLFINFITFAWIFVDVEYYNGLNKPWYSPPSWVFTVVWLINNLLVIMGNIRALNLRKRVYETIKSHEDLEQTKPIRKYLAYYLWFQFFSWVNYVVFPSLAFSLKIPFMFFLTTFSMYLLTIGSIISAFLIDNSSWQGGFIPSTLKLKNITLSLSTLFLWLSLASLLGFHVWTNN